jgi:hypothetical protein
LNETLLWLLYLVSAVTAFLIVQKLGWRIVTSMLAGTAVTVVGWALILALIFAGAGAALAFAMKGEEVE